MLSFLLFFPPSKAHSLVLETIFLGDQSINISMCDVANIMIFATAADLGISGNETPAAINGDKSLIVKVKEVRGKGAQLVGTQRKHNDATRTRLCL